VREPEGVAERDGGHERVVRPDADGAGDLARVGEQLIGGHHDAAGPAGRAGGQADDGGAGAAVEPGAVTPRRDPGMQAGEGIAQRLGFPALGADPPIEQAESRAEDADQAGDLLARQVGVGQKRHEAALPEGGDRHEVGVDVAAGEQDELAGVGLRHLAPRNRTGPHQAPLGPEDPSLERIDVERSSGGQESGRVPPGGGRQAGHQLVVERPRGHAGHGAHYRVLSRR